MRAYRVQVTGISDGIACGVNPSKVRALAIRSLKRVYPSYTWKQGLREIRVCRASMFDEWAGKQETASIVTEESLQKQKRKKRSRF